MPEPRVEPEREAVLPRLPVALNARALVLPWLPLIAVLFFFTVPRREVLIGHRGDYRLEVSQGFRTRTLPVRDVRVEPDADTKRPSLVVDTAVNVEHFDLGATPVPDLHSEAPIEVVLLGSRWWWLFGALVGGEVALVIYFAVRGRRAPA